MIRTEPLAQRAERVDSIDFEADERHVVATRLTAAKCVETEAQRAKTFDDPAARLRERSDQPIQPEGLALGAERLEHAIGVEDETVTRCEFHPTRRSSSRKMLNISPPRLSQAS